MSNTRHAKPGKPLRQERYASSEEFERGLNGFLVARRCSVLKNAEERELIYFLQLCSHQEGGLEQVAADLLTMFSERIGTKSMHHFGLGFGRVYNAKECREILREMPWETGAQFELRGDAAEPDIADFCDDRRTGDDGWDIRPDSYPASKFLEACQDAGARLDETLEAICLDPATSLDNGVWFFPDLLKSLREYQATRIAQLKQRNVLTTLGEKLTDALDYAQKTRCMVLIEGLARMGKTHSAQAWAEQHPGCCRYVQVPSTNDDGSFFRAIAKALGLSTGLGWKAVQLRDRIEETLQAGHLFLILDEAHYCWPISNSRFAFPSRITWIMTALVNKGVPVALISTDQFIRTQKAMEAQTYWRAEQFTGRIGHYEKLPISLSEGDLANVARAILPEGDAKSIELLVCYAQGSAKYLAGITAIVRRARYLAEKEDRVKVTLTDLKRAAQESVIPSDSALANALAEPLKRNKKPLASSLKPRFQDHAESMKEGPHQTQKFEDRNSAIVLKARRDSTPLIEDPIMPG